MGELVQEVSMSRNHGDLVEEQARLDRPVAVADDNREGRFICQGASVDEPVTLVVIDDLDVGRDHIYFGSSKLISSLWRQGRYQEQSNEVNAYVSPLSPLAKKAQWKKAHHYWLGSIINTSSDVKSPRSLFSYNLSSTCNHSQSTVFFLCI